MFGPIAVEVGKFIIAKWFILPFNGPVDVIVHVAVTQLFIFGVQLYYKAVITGSDSKVEQIPEDLLTLVEYYFYIPLMVASVQFVLEFWLQDEILSVFQLFTLGIFGIACNCLTAKWSSEVPMQDERAWFCGWNLTFLLPNAHVFKSVHCFLLVQFLTKGLTPLASLAPIATYLAYPYVQQLINFAETQEYVCTKCVRRTTYCWLALLIVATDDLYQLFLFHASMIVAFRILTGLAFDRNTESKCI